MGGHTQGTWSSGRRSSSTSGRSQQPGRATLLSVATRDQHLGTPSPTRLGLWGVPAGLEKRNTRFDCAFHGGQGVIAGLIVDGPVTHGTSNEQDAGHGSASRPEAVE